MLGSRRLGAIYQLLRSPDPQAGMEARKAEEALDAVVVLGAGMEVRVTSDGDLIV